MKQQCFSSLRNQKKQLLNFHKILWVSYKIEAQKIVNLLNDASNEESKFATKKWYVIDIQTKKDKNKRGDTETIKSSLCDYSDAFILVTGKIKVNASNNTDVAFKNCAPFSICTTENDALFVDKANHIYIAMPMYILIEYSDNYSNTSGSLWQFKRDTLLIIMLIWLLMVVNHLNTRQRF